MTSGAPTATPPDDPLRRERPLDLTLTGAAARIIAAITVTAVLSHLHSSAGQVEHGRDGIIDGR